MGEIKFGWFFQVLYPLHPHDLYSKEDFVNFNRQIKALSHDFGPKVFYFNIAKVLTKNGKPDLTLFKRNDVHLNIKGATLLASNLGVLLRNLK